MLHFCHRLELFLLGNQHLWIQIKNLEQLIIISYSLCFLRRAVVLSNIDLTIKYSYNSLTLKRILAKYKRSGATIGYKPLRTI